MKKGSKKLNKAWLHDHLTDPYVKLAQKEGYRARAAYKLKEIDETLQLVKPGQVVVDLGSTPGAWSQYLRRRFAPAGAASGALEGTIIALDILPMEPIEGVQFILGDFREDAAAQQLAQALAGELEWDYADAYAVTEADAGSDPAGIATTATPTADGWRIDGEKWFVTHGGDCGVYIVMASALVDGGPQPTLFLIDRDADGLEIVDDPDFMHTYPHRHPAIRFTAVEIPRDAVVGEIGAGLDLQRAWFSEERMGIAARGCGSMWRLIEEATAFAIEREQGGQRIYDYQGVAFPLADCAAEAAAARALTLDAVRLADAGADVRLVHAKASMAKLFVSETAFRVADRALQVFGGRGYMRRNVAERLLRELRVDRIWEGTSEIQRVIVARGLERRGVEAIIH